MPPLPDRATAFWTLAPGKGALCQQELPEPLAGDVLIRTLASGISRGTESLVFRGGVPAELQPIMRCPFQDGDFPGPVKYGYALVGIAEYGPANLAGRRVFSLHPHQDVAVVSVEGCRPVPDNVPTERAVLAANMETALNILWDGGAAPGQRIAVVGGGIVGGLAAYLAARMPGAEVTLVDIDPARAEMASTFGARFVTPDQVETGDCDLVVHASATGEGLNTALRLAGQEATVVEASWYGDRPITLSLGGTFHPGRLRIISSQVGKVSPAFRPRWTLSRRLDKALSLLADPVLDMLLGPRIDFVDLPRAMAELSTLPFGCPVVRYQRSVP
ncbi:zinc-dependent alcohol dehydrogenase [Niveispirillum sp. KHB5.9]|uniref:zinc-dependent alcohol dehydrogenase n=1 Tax=Niveispirillum sp. KHB5.9 TaxID=3400269 RepID=UPI003A8824F2